MFIFSIFLVSIKQIVTSDLIQIDQIILLPPTRNFIIPFHNFRPNFIAYPSRFFQDVLNVEVRDELIERRFDNYLEDVVILQKPQIDPWKPIDIWEVQQGEMKIYVSFVNQTQSFFLFEDFIDEHSQEVDIEKLRRFFQITRANYLSDNLVLIFQVKREIYEKFSNFSLEIEKEGRIEIVQQNKTFDKFELIQKRERQIEVADTNKQTQHYNQFNLLRAIRVEIYQLYFEDFSVYFIQKGEFQNFEILEEKIKKNIRSFERSILLCSAQYIWQANQISETVFSDMEQYLNSLNKTDIDEYHSNKKEELILIWILKNYKYSLMSLGIGLAYIIYSLQHSHELAYFDKKII